MTNESINDKNNSRLIFDNAPIGMFIVDGDLIIRQINHAGIRMLGRGNKGVIDDKIGNSFRCINSFSTPQGCGHGSGCESCSLKRALHSVYLTKNSVRGLEYKQTILVGGNKKDVWYKINADPVKIQGIDYVIVVMDDITYRRKAEEGFTRYRILSNNAKDSILIFDTTGNIMEANKAAVSMYGYTEEELLKKNISEIRAKDLNFLKEQFELALDEGILFETLHERKDGSCFPVEVSSQSSIVGDKKAIISIIRDTSERKRIEEELRKAKEAAEEGSKAKSLFLANMSHEIRTPLNGILGMIDLTLNTDLNWEQKENLNIAKASADSLLDIINDILDLSKIEAEQLKIENIKFDIRSLLDETIKIHSKRAKEKGIDLVYQLYSDVPSELVGDPSRLKQILNNLLSNAVKFTEFGQVILSIKKEESTDDDIELVFSVTDTGIGIAKNDIDKLFENFSQLDSSHSRKYGGTGLGLAISKRLVELMGGRMSVKSDLGKGSTFEFSLKFNTRWKDKSEKDTCTEPQDEKNSLKILLAEDDKVNQLFAVRVLNKLGYKVDVANNGIEALDKFNKNDYDIILMDIQMPEMDGVEATARIRKGEKETGRHIPIIAVTAHALQGDREKYLDAGMDDYLAKPFQIKNLYEVIERQSNKIKEAKNCADLNKDNTENNNKTYLAKTDELLKNIKRFNLLLQKLSSNNIKEPYALEGTARIIKEISSRMGVYSIKNLAFKVQLAARRGNMEEIIVLQKKLEEEFNKYMEVNNENINS